MAIEIIEDAIRYQAKTKLKDLALEVAQTKNLSKVRDEIAQGAKIFQWCQALDYGDYLSKADRDIIVRALVDIAEINELPVAPYLGNIDPPTISNQGARGAKGDAGDTGPEGGGVPFSATGVTQDTVCDSFSITDSRGVAYEINIYDDSGSDMRVMRLQAGWNSDGSTYADDGGIGTTIQGDTSPVTMSVIVSGTTVQLFATVTSGEWIIEGTRKYVPNNGNGIVNPTTLASGKIWVGNASNSPVAQTISGDIAISTTGVASIASGVIVDSDVSSTAAIGMSKLASLTASKAVVTSSSGVMTTSATTDTQIGYLSTLTGDVQVALDSKVSASSGAISLIVNSNLTSDRVLVSNPSGKVAVASMASSKLTDLNKIVDGTYTPTYTIGSDWTSATADNNFYTRVVDTVTVTQRILAVSEADGLVKDRTFYISLPVSDTFSDVDDVIGVVNCYNLDDSSARYAKVTADTSNNRATVVVRDAESDASYEIEISFVYHI